MRYQTKIVEIPSGSTKEQIETALNNLTKQGWELVLIQEIGTKYYAILRRLIAG